MVLERESPNVREPSIVDAVIPVVVLILLIGMSLALFGTAATDGPLQVALLLSAAVAALVARKNGHQYFVISEYIVSGVSTAMGALFILLAVGALIGTWNLSGTTATVVHLGIELLRPAYFFFTVALICAAVGMVTGSSWTTAGTIGVAFAGMAPVLGLSKEITAGAIISGAYLGDKMTPLSETTILVPKLVGGLDVYQHIRALLWTTGPAFAIALVLFLAIGLTNDVTETTAEKDTALQAIESAYNVSAVNLLPLLALLVMSLRRWPPFLSILTAALLAGVMAGFTQPDAVRALADDAGLGIVGATVKAIYISMATGFVLRTGIEPIDALFSRGGMASMLTTIWLVLGALSFAAVMESAGFLARLIQPVISFARTTGRLILSVAGTCIGLNIIAGDQYIADVLPARTYRVEFQKRGIHPQVLSRTVDDTGTVTSPLVPWNSCGAYMAGTLGVATTAYFPYCFFNLINPLISVLYGLTGFQVKRIDAVESAEPHEPEARQAA
ncbi:MAG TPA: Na+/H+ antiporter NhaC family protein [Dehalococcoidia bacterium]